MELVSCCFLFVFLVFYFFLFVFFPFFFSIFHRYSGSVGRHIAANRLPAPTSVRHLFFFLAFFLSSFVKVISGVATPSVTPSADPQPLSSRFFRDESEPQKKTKQNHFDRGGRDPTHYPTAVTPSSASNPRRKETFSFPPLVSILSPPPPVGVVTPFIPPQPRPPRPRRTRAATRTRSRWNWFVFYFLLFFFNFGTDSCFRRGS